MFFFSSLHPTQKSSYTPAFAPEHYQARQFSTPFQYISPNTGGYPTEPSPSELYERHHLSQLHHQQTVMPSHSLQQSMSTTSASIQTSAPHSLSTTSVAQLGPALQSGQQHYEHLAAYAGYPAYTHNGGQYFPRGIQPTFMGKQKYGKPYHNSIFFHVCLLVCVCLCVSVCLSVCVFLSLSHFLVWTCTWTCSSTSSVCMFIFSSSSQFDNETSFSQQQRKTLDQFDLISLVFLLICFRSFSIYFKKM